MNLGYNDSNNEFWQKCHCQKCGQVFWQRPRFLIPPHYICLEIKDGIQELSFCRCDVPGTIAFG